MKYVNLIKEYMLFIVHCPLTSFTGHNTDLPSNSNVLKKVRVNIAFTGTFFKEYSISF